GPPALGGGTSPTQHVFADASHVAGLAAHNAVGRHLAGGRLVCGMAMGRVRRERSAGKGYRPGADERGGHLLRAGIHAARSATTRAGRIAFRLADFCTAIDAVDAATRDPAGRAADAVDDDPA